MPFSLGSEQTLEFFEGTTKKSKSSCIKEIRMKNNKFNLLVGFCIGYKLTLKMCNFFSGAQMTTILNDTVYTNITILVP